MYINILVIIGIEYCILNEVFYKGIFVLEMDIFYSYLNIRWNNLWMNVININIVLIGVIYWVVSLFGFVIIIFRGIVLLSCFWGVLFFAGLG